MTLGYKARKRWSLVVLLIGLPAYVVIAVTLVDWVRARYDGFPGLLELAVFLLLGVIWILPLKRVFLGVGQSDPDDRQH